MRRSIYFISLFILFANILLAGVTGRLEGVIRAKSTNTALMGAEVILLETGQGTAVAQDGFYQIHNVRAGTYQVQVRMMGYRPITFTNIQILADRKTKLNADLEESPIELDAVEIRAERPLIQTDVTGTTVDLAGAQIAELPIDDFQDALSLQAGTTFDGHVRGGKVREVIYLIDGMSAQDWVQGGSGMDLPMSAVSQMSIQTGGVNAEYGNALSGIVNVITTTGSDEVNVVFRADKDDLLGGTQVDHAVEAEGSISGPVIKRKLHYFVAARALLTDTRWWQDMQHFHDSPLREEFSGLAKLDLQITPGLHLSAQCLATQNLWKNYEFSWRFNLVGLPSQQRDAIRPALIWTHTLSPKTFYSLTLSHYMLHTKIGEGNAEDVEPIPYAYDFFLQYILSGNRVWWADMRQQTSSMQAQITSQVHPYHQVKAGADLQYFNVDYAVLKMEPQLSYFGKPLVSEPMLNYSSSYHYFPKSGSVYIQDKIEAGRDRSVINLGIRYDFLDPGASRPAVELIPTGQDEYEEQVTEWIPSSIKSHFSPRVGFSFPLSDKAFFFVNYGHYFQYPLFQYLYTGLNNVDLRNGVTVMRGNPDLLAERSHAWEISARTQLFENVVGSITYFQKETFDQIDTKTFVPSNSRIAGDYGFAEFVNNPYANANGFEFVLEREKGRWIRGHVSYTFMTAKGLSETEDQGINYAQWGFPVARHPFYLSWDQRHSLKADMHVDLPWDFSTDMIFQISSGRPYTYYPSKDGFTPEIPTDRFLPNNRRMPGTKFINIKVKKDFIVTMQHPLSPEKVTLYFDGRNLTNEKNVLWMDSSGRIGGELGDPSAYMYPRRMAWGIVLRY
ncbi:TonB-dependent receptor [candidate division KSB1 bacterium]|nr:TonB-dependent receptor [candidate division KSB1 bacterium]